MFHQHFIGKNGLGEFLIKCISDIFNIIIIIFSKNFIDYFGQQYNILNTKCKYCVNNNLPFN